MYSAISQQDKIARILDSWAFDHHVYVCLLCVVSVSVVYTRKAGFAQALKLLAARSNAPLLASCWPAALTLALAPACCCCCCCRVVNGVMVS